MKDVFGKELFVLWFALAALIVAGLSLNASLNKLVNENEQD